MLKNEKDAKMHNFKIFLAPFPSPPLKQSLSYALFFINCCSCHAIIVHLLFVKYFFNTKENKTKNFTQSKTFSLLGFCDLIINFYSVYYLFIVD